MTSQIQSYDKLKNWLCNLQNGICFKTVDYTKNYVITAALFFAKA